MRTNSSINRLAYGSVTVTCVLGILYFGRDVLQPLVLALLLSLVIAPFVGALRRLGLGHMPASLIAVLLTATAVIGVGTVLAFQLVAVAGDLPKYRAAVKAKVENVRQMTERPFARLEAELFAVGPPLASPKEAAKSATTLAPGAARPIPVEIRAPRMTTKDAIARLIALAWGPVGQAGIVLVLLVFILLEHESLRDRFVRLGGQGEVRRTIEALGDAATGVSRFFFSQFVVNVTFGVLIALCLWAAGVPHAALFGALAGMLRFVPYLGVLVAGVLIGGFVAAIDTGWALAAGVMGMFLTLELVVAHVVEPKVYGHSSGMSPLAVIMSALFWGAIWGPVGLLLSTPMTLCLVVAGRHVRALEPVTTLLGDTPSVDAAQRFYHRFLLGDTAAIIADASAYLRHASFARYCDQVLLPGLSMTVTADAVNHFDPVHATRLRAAVAELANTLAPVTGGQSRRQRRRKISLLDTNVGAHLRQTREARLGRWQGSLDVPSRSVVLCAGLGTERDEVLSELLVRALQEAHVDARSVVIDAERDTPGPDAADLVSIVFIAYPILETFEHWKLAAREFRAALPGAMFVTIRLPFDPEAVKLDAVVNEVDMVLRSYEEGLAFVAPDQASAKAA